MKLLRGATQKPENNEDCRVLAPFVMTLFDGEADEIEARRARAHLLVCQTCANRWLDWNRSRALFHSAPVPAPPPQLLWRVLVACRLSKTPHQPNAAPQSAPTPAPSALSAQIFARTTRAAIAAPVPATFSASTRRGFRSFPLSALAAPAFCVWMLMMQRDVWMPPMPAEPDAAVSESLQITSAPRRAVFAAKTPPRAATLRREIAESRAASESESSPPIPIVIRAETPPLRSVSAPISNQRAVSDGRNAAIVRPFIEATAPVFATTQALRVLERNFGAPSDAETAPIRVARREFEPIRVDITTERPVAPRRVSRPLSMARLAAFSTSAVSRLSRTPRLRAAPWHSTRPDLAVETVNANRGTSGAAPQFLRVALPSAPAPQPARLLAENFDSDDARIDEARSVVDDFRAALDSDQNGAELGPDDLENAG